MIGYELVTNELSWRHPLILTQTVFWAASYSVVMSKIISPIPATLFGVSLMGIELASYMGLNYLRERRIISAQCAILLSAFSTMIPKVILAVALVFFEVAPFFKVNTILTLLGGLIFSEMQKKLDYLQDRKRLGKM